MLVEAILTFFLAFAVMGTAVDAAAPKVAGWAIGLTVTMDILAGGSITGAAMNPARAFGPALVAAAWLGQLVYWIGPILGAVAAHAGVRAAAHEEGDRLTRRHPTHRRQRRFPRRHSQIA